MFVQYLAARLRIFIGRLIRDFKELPQRYPEYKIGRGSYGPLEISVFGDNVNLEIGSFCSFAVGVKILLGGEHNKNWVTTYPFDRKYFNQSSLPHSTFSKGDVIIGNDVWIGTDTLILSGTTIGNGVIVAAKSVVRGVLEPYGIYAGIPARLVGKRFEQHVIEKLEKLSWWDWDDDRIKKSLPLLMSENTNSFISECS